MNMSLMNDESGLNRQRGEWVVVRLGASSGMADMPASTAKN